MSNLWRPGWLAALALGMSPAKPEVTQRVVASGTKTASRDKRVERRRAKAARRRNR